MIEHIKNAKFSYFICTKNWRNLHGKRILSIWWSFHEWNKSFFSKVIVALFTIYIIMLKHCVQLSACNSFDCEIMSCVCSNKAQLKHPKVCTFLLSTIVHSHFKHPVFSGAKYFDLTMVIDLLHSTFLTRVPNVGILWGSMYFILMLNFVAKIRMI